VALARERDTLKGWRFSFRRAKVASPSRQRGRLRQWVYGSYELLWHMDEYIASYAWSLPVSTLFVTILNCS